MRARGRRHGADEKVLRETSLFFRSCIGQSTGVRDKGERFIIQSMDRGDCVRLQCSKRASMTQKRERSRYRRERCTNEPC